MKRLSLLLLCSLCGMLAWADLTEDFNSLSSGTWTTETAVVLPSCW